MKEDVTAINPPVVEGRANGYVAERPTLADHPAMMTASLLMRLLVGGVFFVFGADKLSSLAPFGRNIAAYQLVPVELTNIMAVTMTITEIVVGILLIAGLKVRGSAFVSALMLVVFLIAIGWALSQGLEIDCGCSANPEPLGVAKVVEDLGLLAASIFLIYFPKSYLRLGRGE